MPLFGLLGVVVSLAPSPAPTPIYGGTEVPRGEFEAVVSIDDRCTGVLVGPRLVLYAAHCGPDPAEIVVAGTGYAVSGCERFDPHDDAQAAGRGRDFAACELADAPGVAGVVLADADDRDAIDIGQDVVIAGFGIDETGKRGIKRWAQTQVFAIEAEYFGAGGDGVDTCLGDSGSPALIELGGRPRVAGILSYGYACGDGGFYGYGSIARAWLVEAFGDAALASDPEPSGCGIASQMPMGRSIWALACLVLIGPRRR